MEISFHRAFFAWRPETQDHRASAKLSLISTQRNVFDGRGILEEEYGRPLAFKGGKTRKFRFIGCWLVVLRIFQGLYDFMDFPSF